MAKIKETARVLCQERLAEGIYSMWIRAGQIAPQAAPGQFIDVYTRDNARLLPRPISLCEIDREGGRLRIGAHVFFNTNCSVSCMGEIRIGEYCKIGNNVVIVDHDHNYKDQSSEFLTGSIVIGNRVWIGANCTILQGAQIGDDCVIAAGSIVKGVVPAGSVYVQKRQTTVTDKRAGSGKAGV